MNASEGFKAEPERERARRSEDDAGEEAHAADFADHLEGRKGFAEPGAIQKALSLPLFGTILCTLGVRACWTRQSRWARVAVVLLLGLGLVQFVAFYRSLVILRA